MRVSSAGSEQGHVVVCSSNVQLLQQYAQHAPAVLVKPALCAPCLCIAGFHGMWGFITWVSFQAWCQKPGPQGSPQQGLPTQLMSHHGVQHCGTADIATPSTVLGL